jgi:hypothetical protein
MHKIHAIGKLIVILILFTAAIPLVCSLGISPASVSLDFYPGLTTNLTFRVHNNVGYDTYIIPQTIESSLTPYVTPVQTEKIFVADGENAYVTFQVKFPDEVDFAGKHQIDVGATESISPSIEGSGIVAITAIYARVYVFIPYPGKYLEAIFNAKNVALNETVHFKVNIQNKGKEKLNSITGKIDIYDKENKIDTLILPSFSDMDVYDTKDVIMNWSTIGRTVGMYKATLTMNYDGNSRKFDTTFYVGDESLEILNFTKEVEAETISRFAINVQSVWNLPLKNVWAEAKFSKDGSTIHELKTPATEVNPWETKELLGYFDGSGVALGEYDADIKVHYNNKVAETKGVITVVKPKQEEKPPVNESAKPAENLFTQSTIFLGIAILAIILLIINIFITLKRKK